MSNECKSLSFSLYSVRRVGKSCQPENFSCLNRPAFGEEKVPTLMETQNGVCEHSHTDFGKTS